jgi:hypothetical protein
MRPVARLAACAGLVTAAACIEITVDGDAVGSLEFLPFPYPSVYAGDTLRDANGAAARLRANVYLGNGSLDSNRTVSFLTFDTVARIDSTGPWLIGRPLAFTSALSSFDARVIAAVGPLQSQLRTIPVVPRPDTIASQAPADHDTIFYSLPAAATDTSMALLVRLTTGSGTSVIGVPFHIVRYRLFDAANQPLTATDTTLAFFLVDDGGRVTAVDTTDGGGNASRRVRFRIRQGQAAVDSVRVLAQVSRGSRIVPGDSITWVVVVRPKS